MALTSQELRAARRQEQGEDGRVFQLRYALWRDVTPAGESFYYLKCVCQQRRGPVAGETELEIADGLGNDPALANAIFDRLAGAASPPLPVHLKEMVHDLVAEMDAHRPALAAP